MKIIPPFKKIGLSHHTKSARNTKLVIIPIIYSHVYNFQFNQQWHEQNIVLKVYQWTT
jgi:hypothetical protein